MTAMIRQNPRIEPERRATAYIYIYTCVKLGREATLFTPRAACIYVFYSGRAGIIIRVEENHPAVYTYRCVSIQTLARSRVYVYVCNAHSNAADSVRYR